MPAPVPEEHPLQDFFAALVQRSFERRLRWRDEEVESYVSGLLVDFSHVDRLYARRTDGGLEIRRLAELLWEGDVRLGAESFERERDVQKHIGDFSLFWSGLYRPHLDFLRRRPIEPTSDAFLDYVAIGKRSYAIVSEFGEDAPFPGPRFFRRLSERFEWAVAGLEGVAEELRRVPPGSKLVGPGEVESPGAP
jgi:hypothetical protein